MIDLELIIGAIKRGNHKLCLKSTAIHPEYFYRVFQTSFKIISQILIEFTIENYVFRFDDDDDDDYYYAIRLIEVVLMQIIS